MKKKMTILLVLVLAVSMIMVLSGCSNKSVDSSKLVVDEFYEAYDDYDAHDMIETFHDDLINNYASEEELEIILLSRIAVYGEIDEYKLVGTSYYKNNGVITVTLDMEVTYKNTDGTFVESFDLVNDGDDMLILNVYHENEAPYDKVPVAFFKAYSEGDDDSLTELFSDAFYSYITKEDMMEHLDNLEVVYGEYNSYILKEEWSYYSEIDVDDVVVIYEGIYDVSYSNGSISMTIQLCVEDDDIKIFDIFWSGE